MDTVDFVEQGNPNLGQDNVIAANSLAAADYTDSGVPVIVDLITDEECSVQEGDCFLGDDGTRLKVVADEKWGLSWAVENSQ